jgi:hypothetical protein
MEGDYSMSPLGPEPPIDLSISRLDAYHSVVGAIASEWAALEFYMDYLVWQLARVEQHAGACITSQLNGTGPRMRTIVALLHLRNVPLEIVKKFNKFESGLFPIQTSRNRAVHDTWAYDQMNRISQLRIAITDKKVDFGITPVEFDDLVKIKERIQKIGAEFRMLLADVFELLPPSPGISPYIPSQTHLRQPSS